jgi:rhodanese-related sulfurtransferase
MPAIRLYIIFVLLFLCTACGDTAYHQQLNLLYRDLTPRLSADSLARLMEQPDSFLLLDTREVQEWEISYIPHTQHADFENFTLDLPPVCEQEVLRAVPREFPIVLYCTIGYRSEQIGAQLLAAGYGNVSHLYGGIIEWKNQAYPLLNNNAQPTDSVHTYNRYWGMFLNKGIPVYE